MVMAVLVADHEHCVRVARGLSKRVGLSDIVRHRFFDVHVFAGIQSGDQVLEVRAAPLEHAQLLGMPPKGGQSLSPSLHLPIANQ